MVTLLKGKKGQDRFDQLKHGLLQIGKRRKINKEEETAIHEFIRLTDEARTKDDTARFEDGVYVLYRIHCYIPQTAPLKDDLLRYLAKWLDQEERIGHYHLIIRMYGDLGYTREAIDNLKQAYPKSENLQAGAQILVAIIQVFMHMEEHGQTVTLDDITDFVENNLVALVETQSSLDTKTFRALRDFVRNITRRIYEWENEDSGSDQRTLEDMWENSLLRWVIIMTKTVRSPDERVLTSEAHWDVALILYSYADNAMSREERMRGLLNKRDGKTEDNRPALNEAPFCFNDFAFTHMPDLGNVSPQEKRRLRDYIIGIFHEVRKKYLLEALWDHRVSDVSILRKMKFFVRGLNNSLLPTAIAHREGVIEIHENFVRLMAYLRTRGMMEVKGRSGRTINWIGHIVYAVAHHEIRGHFPIVQDPVSKEWKIVFDIKETDAQAERGFPAWTLNVTAMLFYWLSLCENLTGEALHERIIDFLDEGDDPSGLSNGEMLGIYGQDAFANIVKNVETLAKDTIFMRPRPEDYVRTNETRETAYRKAIGSEDANDCTMNEGRVPAPQANDSRIADQLISSLPAPTKVIVVGGSYNGYEAFREILNRLPKYHPPIIFIEHRKGSPEESGYLEEHPRVTLTNKYTLKRNLSSLEENRIYWIKDAAPSQIDALFKQVAKLFKQYVVGVIISGCSDDGAEGAKAIQEAGGHIIVEEIDLGGQLDPFIMSHAVRISGIQCEEVAIEHMAAEILKYTNCVTQWFWSHDLVEDEKGMMAFLNEVEDVVMHEGVMLFGAQDVIDFRNVHELKQNFCFKIRATY
jgi:hypothetical protein